ncbi:DUF1292 domain-containing protein [Anaerosinus massiliensis]|uniref:DUF1292 domain-containing protein n=1 Tax=Massilibacillus massiliensis TaxID=1806837 RepID=UPI000DA60696|nr:DUF1292 domain-containing protein [Massilibacillus massiliensis]
MTDKEKDMMDENEELVVVMTDEEGNEFYYREELIIPVGDEKFALLVAISDECEDEGCDCGCGDEDAFIAKIVKNEAGEEEYIEPTDEEYEAVQKAYDALMEEEEAE